ncbi:MAG: DNA polymerase III subunit alpha, partial [Patescibacteria group bacterium]
MQPFVHLHTHSHYSLLQALPKIDDLVETAKENGMDALALTDNGNLYGAIEFYKACKEEGIKPIIGVDFYVAARSRHDKQPSVDRERYRLVLLAKDFEGYQNLMALVTKSYLEGFFDRPRIDRELMEKYSKGLIGFIPCLKSDTSSALKNNDAKKAEEKLNIYKKIYGKDNIYLEITAHPELDWQESLLEKIIGLGKKCEVPVAASQEVYYLNPSDKQTTEIMRRIQHGVAGVNEEDDGDFSFFGEERVQELFKKFPEAIKNTRRIADACNLELDLGKWKFPGFEIKSGKTYDQELRDTVYQGAKERSMEITPEVKERIEYELRVIADKNFSSYFLVVADLLRFTREKDIYTTTRGSVGGSIVAYLTFITTVDPIAYKLPFERFLNPERPKAPDIDMDLADNRRDEVIEYAKGKYGEERVAQIGTFGTMLARAAVRDIARAMGKPYAVGDRIAKLIPMGSQGFPMTIDRALEITPELASLYDSDLETKEVVDAAKKIEGCARHISVHAAGVVIAPTPLIEWTPLQQDPKGGKVITQYDMYALTDEYGGVGLMKFDFLGIRNLAILADSVRLVKKFRDLNIDTEKIPIDDKRTYEMLARGETMGLFQLGGSGMTRFLKDLKPTSIHDINAMVALYRPGPMEVIPEYIRRKHNPALVVYPDPRMEKYLKESYGLIVYQDDLLLSTIELAGYSWLQADKFRKAVGKKIPKEMAAEKDGLIEGIIKHGQTKDFADKLWKLFEPFAAYGFNKAHAASYGRVAYQTAYMKANFPGEYITAILTAESGDLDTVAEIVAEGKRMDIETLPPDINESQRDFTLIKGEKDRIRFGLGSIKNFGEGIADSIIAERDKNERFVSLGDFLSRVTNKNLNKKSLEALILSGAMDSFGERNSMFLNIESLLSFHKEQANQKGQGSLLGLLGDSSPEITLPETPPMKPEEKLEHEKELLGLYVSGHPLDKYKDKIGPGKTSSIKDIKEEKSEGEPAVVIGLLESLRPVQTKGGESMAFLKLSDYTGSMEAVVFPRMYA